MKRLAAIIIIVVIGAVFWTLRPRGDPDAGPGPRTNGPPIDEKDTKPGSSGIAGRMQPYPRSSTSPREPEPSGRLRIEGLVLDDTDQPLGSVSVAIDTIPARITATDRGGAFAFDDVRGRPYELVARLRDLVGGPVRVDPAWSVDPVVIRMRAGCAVDVSVVTREAGLAVPGALVELRGRTIVQARTDEAGRVSLRGVLAGPADLAARAPGFAISHRSVDIIQGRAEPLQVQVALRRGSTVTGRVIDEQGAPISEAIVVAVDAAALGARVGRDRDGTRTDASGRFELPPLAPGTYRIKASHPAYLSASSASVSVQGSSRPAEVVLSLKAGVRICGRVEAPDGRPAAWAVVRCTWRGGPLLARESISGEVTRSGTADEQGRFAFAGLPATRLSLLAMSEDALSDPLQVDLQSRHGTDEILLRLKSASGLSGEVVDDAGEPVHDAQVRACPDSLDAPTIERTLRGDAETVTDGGGRFSFRNLAPGSYRLYASRSLITYRQGLKAGVPARTGDDDVRLVVHDEGGVLKGRLVFSDGGNPSWLSVAFEHPPGIGLDSTDGSFEIAGAPPGIQAIFIHGREFSYVDLKDVEIRPGQTTDLGVIQVERGRSITGRVVDPSGSAVQGATVLCALGIMGDGTNLSVDSGTGSDEALELRRTLSGEDGTFALEGIGSSPRVIIAEFEGIGRSDPTAIPEGREPLDYILRLGGFGRVAGTITLGKRPVAASVTASPGGSGRYTLKVMAGRDGAFVIPRIAVGQTVVSAEVRDAGAKGFKSASRQVVIHEGEETRADIEIPAGYIALSVNVRALDGAVIDLAPVYLLPGEARAATAAELDGLEGSLAGVAAHSFWTPGRPAAFSDLPAGTYMLCAVPLQGEVEDQAFVTWMKKNLARLRAHCKAIQIDQSPSTQSIDLALPGMELL